MLMSQDKMTPGSSACEVCCNFDQELLIQRGNERAAEFYICRLQELSKSAQRCFTCGLLIQACRHCFTEAVNEPELYSVVITVNTTPGRALSLTVRNKLIDGDTVFRSINFHSFPDKPCPWSLFKPWPAIPCDRQLLAHQVKSWIDSCEKNHPECSTSALQKLPKRVVQIAPSPKAGEFKVRLVESIPSAHSLYACLSHCWGKHQIIQTKQHNLAKHQAEIPWDSLSTTFQDSIAFCHILGIEYIWIDSLCIIQDSGKDWEEEAAKMSDYYANAYITLAATSALDGTVGFFPKRRDYDEPLELHGTDPRGRLYSLMASTHIYHPYEVSPGADFIPDFPLMTRGWVYQEQMLSRRYLHFCQRELVWECRSETACQCGLFVQGTDWQLLRTNSSRSVMRHDLNTISIQKLRELWYDNVESMMKLDFTFLRDRLPAAAGLVSHLAKAFHTRYLAGLWEDSLVEDLCWFVDEYGRRPKELAGMPSWSWASVAGGLDTVWCQRGLSDDTVTMAAQVVDIDCVSNGPIFLGRLTRGVIALQGSVVDATISVQPDPDPDAEAENKCTLVFEGVKDDESAKSDWFFYADAPCNETNIRNGARVKVIKMITGQLKRTHRNWAIFLVLQLLEGHDDRVRE